MRFLIHALCGGFQGAAAQLHIRLQLKNQENTNVEDFVLRKMFHLLNVVADQRPAGFRGLIFFITLHALCIVADIGGAVHNADLQMGRRNFQVAGKVVNQVFLFHVRFQVEQDRKHFQNFYDPPILEQYHAVSDIGNRKPPFRASFFLCRQAENFLRRAQKPFFEFHCFPPVSTSLGKISPPACAASAATRIKTATMNRR